MFVHLYSKDTFGFVKNRVDNLDIEITDIEYNNIIQNQFLGKYYVIKDNTATNLKDLFNIIDMPEQEKPVVIQMQEDLSFISNILLKIIEPMMLPEDEDNHKKEILFKLKEIIDRYSENRTIGK